VLLRNLLEKIGAWQNLVNQKYANTK
jgi:hypothetical protein